MSAGRYSLGLPAWAFPGWKDRYFEDQPSRLASYATVFNTVEGNTTFYRIPDSKSVRSWREAVARRDFRFCFKLPREVTHERSPDLDALRRFLDAIKPLGENLGPFLVQFPKTVGPDEIAAFEPVFETLTEKHRFTMEVRHPKFFDEPALLEPVLDRFDAGRIMMDSRPIFEGDRGHPDVRDALHEKPDVPVLTKTYGNIVLVRLILHPDLRSNSAWIDEWAARTARYLRDGDDVYMMIHCPNNLHCPPLAKTFHERLLAEPGVSISAALPAWPIPQQADLLSG